MQKYLLVLLLIAVLPMIQAEDGHHHTVTPAAAESNGKIWTCSMHPQIRLNQPGKCPICHMDLIPAAVANSPSPAAAPELTLSPEAEKLAEVRTSKVERRFIPLEIPLNGRLDIDESSVADIALRFPGRVDKLFVNYTGVVIRRGEHLAEVFSPDLAVMQNEYLIELRSPRRGALESVKDKMRQWGFSPAQIAEIGQKGTVSDRLTINAPIDGTVIEKHVVDGQYFNKEERLFRLADLSRLWLLLDVYEMDLPFIRYGQEVEFRTDSQPGRSFSGVISYLGPVLDPKTRTVPVRVNLANPDGRLKPGMYVKATVRTVLDAAGEVIDDRLTGKWISPMHPEIIRDRPGKCDICGMALVPAASLGYSALPADRRQAPLLIPATAPLLTGKRSLVYIRTAPGRYQPRQVELGPKCGDFYPVRSGLAEGDEVVISGNMKIDGAMQIAGLPSMTSPENFTPAAIEAQPAQVSAEELLGALLAIHAPLVKDDAAAATAALRALREKAAKFGDAARRAELLALIPAEIPGGIVDQRALYGRIAAWFSRWSESPGFKPGAVKYHRFRCSMALEGQGGVWFQAGSELENPYFGAAMLKCGEEL
ncbi:MAG: efflux RND transporter periplasmic adaptor subunit [Victivallaceae bacterium]